MTIEEAISEIEPRIPEIMRFNKAYGEALTIAVKSLNEKKAKIEDIKWRIFLIQQADFLSHDDWKLIDKYRAELKELEA